MQLHKGFCVGFKREGRGGGISGGFYQGRGLQYKRYRKKGSKCVDETSIQQSIKRRFIFLGTEQDTSYETIRKILEVQKSSSLTMDKLVAC